MPRSAGLKPKAVLVAALAAAGVAAGALSPAQAGTTGGIYSFEQILQRPHPFANVPSGFDTPPVGAVPPMPSSPTMSTQPLSNQPVLAPVPAAAPQPAPAQPVAQTQPRAQTAPPPPSQPAAPPPPPRSAEPRDSGSLFNKLYFTVMAGYDQPGDLSGTTSNGQAFNTDVDAGFMAGIALGRYFGRSVRGEAEIAFRSADYKQTTSGGSTSTGGSLESTALMLNGYYGFQFNSPIVPYIGAGVGAAFLDGSGGVVGGANVPKRSSTEFGYQGMLGVAWTFASGYAVGLEGRYFGTTDNDVKSTMVLLNVRFDL